LGASKHALAKIIAAPLSVARLGLALSLRILAIAEDKDLFPANGGCRNLLRFILFTYLEIFIKLKMVRYALFFL
jgi:hypothetical protein